MRPVVCHAVLVTMPAQPMRPFVSCSPRDYAGSADAACCVMQSFVTMPAPPMRPHVSCGLCHHAGSADAAVCVMRSSDHAVLSVMWSTLSSIHSLRKSSSSGSHGFNGYLFNYFILFVRFLFVDRKGNQLFLRIYFMFLKQKMG